MATINLTASLVALVRIAASATVTATPGVPGMLTASTAAPRLTATSAGARLTATTSGGDA